MLICYPSNLFKIHKPLEMSQRLVSEYLPPTTKTVIEYDCMPTFANIQTATIVDMDENRVVKSFGIKQGIGLEIKILLNHHEKIQAS